VWDMARRFGTSLTGVTWEMLESVEHRPVVVLRRPHHSDGTMLSKVRPFEKPRRP